MKNLLDFLEKYFLPKGNYFVQQTKSCQIDETLFAFLHFPGNRGTEKLSRKARRQLDALFKKIGWVPDLVSMFFLNDTVEQEIADAVAARNNLLFAEKAHFNEAMEMMTEFNLLNLIGKNPFYLSAGESKLVWLLTQIAKQPEFLVIGNLLVSLSRQRVEQLLCYFEKFQSKTARQTSIIVGHDQTLNEAKLASKITPAKWKFTNKWIEI